MVYDKALMKSAITLFLKAVGEKENDAHTGDTPERCSKMWEILLGGKDKDPNSYVKTFPLSQEGEEFVTPVMMSNIKFYGFCAHHLLPFYGLVSIAYIPKNKIIGLSKLARISRHFARVPQVQERLTKQIADFIQNCDLDPQGVMVIIDAVHMCVSQRGVRCDGTKTRTIWITGEYQINERLRDRFENYVNSMTDINLFRY